MMNKIIILILLCISPAIYAQSNYFPSGIKLGDGTRQNTGFTDVLKGNYDAAFAAKHTHSNLSLLSSIDTSATGKWQTKYNTTLGFRSISLRIAADSLKTAAFDTIKFVKTKYQASLDTTKLGLRISASEPNLGNPPTNGYTIVSTATGVRSWVPKTDNILVSNQIGTVTVPIPIDTELDKVLITPASGTPTAQVTYIRNGQNDITIIPPGQQILNSLIAASIGLYSSTASSLSIVISGGSANIKIFVNKNITQ